MTDSARFARRIFSGTSPKPPRHAAERVVIPPLRDICSRARRAEGSREKVRLKGEGSGFLVSPGIRVAAARRGGMLSREQGVFRLVPSNLSQNPCLSITFTSFGWVIMQSPGTA